MSARAPKGQWLNDTRPGHLFSLTESLDVDCIACVLSSCAQAHRGLILVGCRSDGARALSLMARSCRLLGLKGQLDGKGRESTALSMTGTIAQELCKEAGVCRLPLTMGAGWCWSRMLYWLADAVRVGPHHELKTVQGGIRAARKVQVAMERAGGALVEGSVLVLVEPGVYKEAGSDVDDCNRVSIWRCDRQSSKGDVLKVEWTSVDQHVLILQGKVSVSVNGVHMAATKSALYNGSPFVCVGTGDGSALTLERCNLTSAGATIIQIGGTESSALVSGCCIHDGMAGVFIGNKAKAVLENNDIHSLIFSAVQVQDEGTEAVLRGNTIHHGKQAGVYVFAKAKADLFNNVIHSTCRAGVRVDDASQVALRGNRLFDSEGCGVLMSGKGTMGTLENNIITSNDLPGVLIFDCSAISCCAGNTVEGNGRCKIKRSEEALKGWPPAAAACYHAGEILPGVFVAKGSAINYSGPNTIEKHVGSGPQKMIDENYIYASDSMVTDNASVNSVSHSMVVPSKSEEEAADPWSDKGASAFKQTLRVAGAPLNGGSASDAPLSDSGGPAPPLPVPSKMEEEAAEPQTVESCRLLGLSQLTALKSQTDGDSKDSKQ